MSMDKVFSAERTAGMREYFERFAAGFGVYDIQMPSRLPNTRRALAMAEFARDHGKLDLFRRLAMEAHWKEGKDLESTLDLAELASLTGLDAKRAVEAADSPQYLGRVDELHEEASRMGVTGIPTFIMGKERVVGCQPYDELARAATRAGATKRTS
jgi:predicted DsbA family dithiol-disulfide isomerase